MRILQFDELRWEFFVEAVAGRAYRQRPSYSDMMKEKVEEGDALTIRCRYRDI